MVNTVSVMNRYYIRNCPLRIKNKVSQLASVYVALGWCAAMQFVDECIDNEKPLK